MAVIYGRLADIQFIPSTAGSIYANPASTKTFVKGIEFHNTNTTAEVVELHNVPDASGSLGTAALANRKLKVTLAPDETYLYEWPGNGLVLQDTNDSLQARTTTASRVTVDLFGLKEA